MHWLLLGQGYRGGAAGALIKLKSKVHSVRHICIVDNHIKCGEHEC